MNAEQKCFFCNNECIVNEMASLSYSKLYRCGYCGEYLLDPQDKKKLSAKPDDRFKIACILNERRLKALGGIALDIKTDMENKVFGRLPRIAIDDILKTFPSKTNDLIDRTLINLSLLSNPAYPFENIRLGLATNKDYLHLFSRSKEAAYTFLQELANQGYIRFNRVKGGEQWDVFCLTPKGWEKVENFQQACEIHDNSNGGNASMEYDVFISHASEDKDFVRPLAEALVNAGLKVWYDQFELKLGDSLREKIDQGLANSRYGIIVLSNSFFAKPWPKSELDALVTRQNKEGKKVILPIWHEVEAKEVSKFSPILASRLAAKSSDGVAAVVEEILKVCREILEEQKAAYKNKQDAIENEEVLNAKPPEFLQNLLWVIKDGKKHWKLILLAIIVLGVITSLRYGLHNKIFNLLKGSSITSYGRTPLYPRTQKRVYDICDRIEEEKLNPWLFINMDKMHPVTMHNGKVISYKGVLYEGAPRIVFWSDDFIPPFIEDAIVQVFDETIEECRKNNLEPKPYIDEANSILFGFISHIYSRMAYIDQKLSSAVDSQKAGRKDVSDEVEKMHRCLKEHYDAAILLASRNEKISGNLKD